MTSPTHARIEALIEAHPIVLFMKGTASMPQCGFSAAAVGLLRDLGQPFHTVDVLSDPELREGIKVFSQWPTIPQLYVRKEFIGGSDIMRQMAASGELHAIVGVPFAPPAPPKVTLTPAMIKAFVDAGLGPGEHPRLMVGPGFQYQVGIDGKRPDDFVVACGGLELLVDRDSAKRADGLTLDFQPGEGGGILIDNPNEPAQVKQLDVVALAEMRRGGRALRLIDVRTPDEHAQARIEGAELLDASLLSALMALPKDSLLVFHCHHGGRSQAAAQRFVAEGFRKVYNVQGGIDAWSIHVDPSVPRY
ncbi:MAG: Grx4 family monothiol glutaredoxin [Deltaproteobacteria bacterium]|nr:Grx4 family monothiol glutaredoxin [Deltaproteobacteria bacterium]